MLIKTSFQGVLWQRPEIYAGVARSFLIEFFSLKKKMYYDLDVRR